MKKLLSYILFLLLAANSTMSWAADVQREISVHFNQPRVTLEGNEIIDKESAFVYEGRIYVPLRQLAEALRHEVDWREETNEAILTKEESNTIIEPCDPFKGESFIYGQITHIDFSNRTIRIEQHFDDNSREVFEALVVSKDASILIRRGDKQLGLDFTNVKVGDVVSLVLTKENVIRSIEIDV